MYVVWVVWWNVSYVGCRSGRLDPLRSPRLRSPARRLPFTDGPAETRLDSSQVAWHLPVAMGGKGFSFVNVRLTSS